MVRASLEPAAALDSGFARRLTQTDLLPAGSRVLVALSGGIDSVCLLHLLRFRCAGLDYGLCAAHFDHRMRPGSAEHAAWVRGLCRAWAVPLIEDAAAGLLHNEQEARRARYAFLERAAARSDASRIVTAHHADDQVETIVFRLLRGTGLRGLAGIPERRGPIVRPLLPWDRRAILAYAGRHGVRALDDPSNTDRRFARNRIRHDILPALDRAMPGARAALLRLSREAIASEEAWTPIIDALLDRILVEQTTSAIRLAREGLLGYHRQIRGRLIRRAFERLGRVPGRSGTLAALAFITSGASGHHITLAGGYGIEREFDRFVLRAPSIPDEVGEEPFEIRADEGRGRVRLAGRLVEFAWRTATDRVDAEIALDPAVLRFPLQVRCWRPGDRIRTAAGTRKLKKIFAEKRIPRSDRSRRCLLAGADGRILWVEGVGRSAGAEAAQGARALLFRWTHGNDG